MLKPSDLISLLCFLDNFETACDSDSNHEFAAMCLFPYITREPYKVALSQRVTEDNKNHQKKVKLTTYNKVLNYLFELYATGDVSTEAGARKASF